MCQSRSAVSGNIFVMESIWDAMHETFDIEKRSKAIQTTLVTNWHLGFTAFGGPNVHFQIVLTHCRAS